MSAFGPFELSKQLARGGMGEIFLARRRDDPNRTPLVLKRMRPELADDAEYKRRLLFEAQVASRLVHPNLVRLVEYGQVGQCYYLAMEHVRGHSLTRLLQHALDHDQPPNTLAALTITAGLLEALAVMHGAKDDAGSPRPILHRDVTPGNVIVTLQGRPVLIDYGIAKDVLGPAITQIGMVLGTARYMSPEHRKGEYIDARADIFSVSVILFELLSARRPWPPMSGGKELLRVVFDPPEIDPVIGARIPADVLALVLRGLSCDREDRFRDAAEFRSALASSATFLAMSDRGEAARCEAIQAWVESTGEAPDEAIEGLVVDNKPAKADTRDDLVWSPKGQIKPASEHDTRDTLPPSRILTIPPLPPRRQSILAPADLEIPKAWPPRYLKLAVAGGLVLLGVMLSFMVKALL